MSGRDYLHIWYETQLVAALFFLLVISGWEMYVGIHQGYLMIFLGVITAIGLIVASLPAVPTWLAATNRWLQAIFQPLALLMVWGTVTRQIIVRLQLPARGVVVLALIYYLIMFAPLASEIGGAFKWGLSRLCYSFYWFLLIILGMTISLPVKFAGPPIMQTIVSSHVVGALAFLITATTLMRAWELAWPGLLPKFGWGWSWLTFAFLVAVDLVVTGVNIGGVSLTTLRQGLTSSSNFLVALCYLGGSFGGLKKHPLAPWWPLGRFGATVWVRPPLERGWSTLSRYRPADHGDRGIWPFLPGGLFVHRPALVNDFDALFI